MEYGQPLFVWLSRDRAYVRVYRLYGYGRGDYQKEGRGISGVSWQIQHFPVACKNLQFKYIYANRMVNFIRNRIQYIDNLCFL